MTESGVRAVALGLAVLGGLLAMVGSLVPFGPVGIPAAVAAPATATGDFLRWLGFGVGAVGCLGAGVAGVKPWEGSYILLAAALGAVISGLALPTGLLYLLAAQLVTLGIPRA
jgi:hypothetical protein